MTLHLKGTTRPWSYSTRPSCIDNTALSLYGLTLTRSNKQLSPSSHIDRRLRNKYNTSTISPPFFVRYPTSNRDRRDLSSASIPVSTHFMVPNQPLLTHFTTPSPRIRESTATDYFTRPPHSTRNQPTILIYPSPHTSAWNISSHKLVEIDMTL